MTYSKIPKVPFEKRIKDNIKNYSLKNLYELDFLKEYLKCLARAANAEVLLTDRHGEKAVAAGNFAGNFAGFTPDVVGEPGLKIRVQNRTIGHLYVRQSEAAAQESGFSRELWEKTAELLSRLGEEAYRHNEYAAYLDELEEPVFAGRRRIQRGEREDALTGVFNRSYFESRMQVIDRSEVAPVAIINANINDWKFVNDHFGDEESDRLIQLVASFLKEEAKPDYIIGRTDGDVFHIIIPMPEEGEAEGYCARVEEACAAFEDERLAPSVAFGHVYKTNVEETLSDKMSDAEYEMFDRKYEMKHAPGYLERLQKGLQKASITT